MSYNSTYYLSSEDNFVHILIETRTEGNIYSSHKKRWYSKFVFVVKETLFSITLDDNWLLQHLIDFYLTTMSSLFRLIIIKAFGTSMLNRQNGAFR